MPLPKPGQDESQDEFIPRCISTIVKSPDFKPGNTPDGRKQAEGMCFSRWRNKDKLSKIKNGRILYLNQLSAQIEFTDDSKKEILNLSAFKNMSEQQNGIIRLPRSTLLIGDKLYNNVWHPADELQKSYQTMEHQPFIIDHKDGIEDEIGFMENTQYDPETKKLTAIPVLNLNTAKGNTALNHIRNRLMASKAPETSVGFWASEHIEQIALLENAEHISARDWEFDHNSLVTRGAGSPDMGIGIGLNKQSNGSGFDLIKNIEKMELNKKEMIKMTEEKSIETPKVEPSTEKFTMSKEEFHVMMKDEMAKQAEVKKQENKDVEFDAMKKKLADAEAQLATRTTATRDNTMTTNGAAPMSKKTKEIRSQIIGMAVIKTLAQTDSDIHIHYVNEQNLPSGAR